MKGVVNRSNPEFMSRVFWDSLSNIALSLVLYFVTGYIPGWIGTVAKWLFVAYCAFCVVWNLFFVAIGIVPAVMLLFGKGSIADEATAFISSIFRIFEAGALTFFGYASWTLANPKP